MRFEELCLVCENDYRLALLKGNYGNPLTAGQYEKTIRNYISTKTSAGYSKFIFYLNKPNQQDKCHIDLIYYVNREGNIPAKYFLYSIPFNTLKKFRELGEEIKSRKNEAYFQPLLNIFYYRNRPIPKFFPEKDLNREMESLIKVSEYFKNKFGKQYAFLGDVYTLEEGSKISKIAANLQRNKEDIQNLPKYFKDWWGNL